MKLYPLKKVPIFRDDTKQQLRIKLRTIAKRTLNTIKVVAGKRSENPKNTEQCNI